MRHDDEVAPFNQFGFGYGDDTPSNGILETEEGQPAK